MKTNGPIFDFALFLQHVENAVYFLNVEIHLFFTCGYVKAIIGCACHETQ